MPDQPLSRPESALVRALGVPQLAAAIINCTVGAGIFVLPAVVAQGLGAAAPVAFLVCAGIMLLVVTTFALAGSRVALTGGVYAYVEVAFGPYIGFLAGVVQWLAFCLAVAAVATALMAQLSTMAPVLAVPFWRGAALVAIFGALAAVNIRGVRAGTRLVGIATAAKLAPLLLFLLAGVFYVQPSAIAWPGLPETQRIKDTVLLLIFAFTGIDVALAPGGEVKNPARTVPRAVFLALGVTATLYMAIQLVAQGVLGSELAQNARAPLATAAGRFLGNGGRALMLLGGIVSMFGYLTGDMLGTPRSLYAFGRDGFLPAVFGRIHARYRTPVVAIAGHAVVIALLAATSTFLYLLILTNVATLALYLMCCGAAFELIRRDVRTGGTPFSVPGARVVPVLAGLAVAWVLSSATRAEWGVLGAVLGVATLIYWLRKGASSWLKSRARAPAVVQ